MLTSRQKRDSQGEVVGYLDGKVVAGIGTATVTLTRSVAAAKKAR